MIQEIWLLSITLLLTSPVILVKLCSFCKMKGLDWVTSIVFQLFHSVTLKLTTKASEPSWSCLKSISEEFSLQEIEKLKCLLFYNHNINIFGESWYQIVLIYYIVCYNNILCQIQKRQLVSFHFLKVIYILNQLCSGFF